MTEAELQKLQDDLFKKSIAIHNCESILCKIKKCNSIINLLNSDEMKYSIHITIFNNNGRYDTDPLKSITFNSPRNEYDNKIAEDIINVIKERKSKLEEQFKNL